MPSETATSLTPSARPRLLICSAGVPHESQGASVVLFFHYIQRLHQAGYDIFHLLLLEGDGWSDAAVAEYGAKMTGPAAFEVQVLRSSKFVRTGLTQLRLDRDPKLPAMQRAGEFTPDIILAFDILPAWMLADIPARSRIVWLGDLNFQSFLWNAIYAVSENVRAAANLPLIWLVCVAWKRLYRRVLKKADAIIVSSDSSRAHLARLGVNSEYEPYPWPETTPLLVSRSLPERPTFLFFGNLVGLGSRSALHFIVDKLYPLLCRRWGKGDFSVFFAGRGKLPEWFARSIQDKPEFEFLGFVDQIDALMTRCHAVLAPIDVPVGNRSRILTAMAKGALIIAHENVALGNPDLVDGETCYLAKDAEGFAERMLLSVENRGASEAIIGHARQCYETRFHPDVAARKMVELVAKLDARPSTLTV